MDDASLGWAAGIFEGEGNAKVYVVHVRTFNKTEGMFVRYPAKRPSIQVVNTDISILARFRVIVGVGTVRVAKRASGNNKMLFHYRVEGRKALLVARLLLPFIVSKRKQLQLQTIVDYYNNFTTNWHQAEASRKVWASYTAEQRQARRVAISLGRRRRKNNNRIGSKADKGDASQSA